MSQLNFSAVLGLAALVLICLLIAKLLLQSTGDKLAKYLLVCLLVSLTGLILNQLYTATQLLQSAPHLSYTNVVLMFSIAPSLYFYISRVTTGAAPYSQRLWFFHWSPLLLIIVLTPYYFKGAPEKLDFIKSQEAVLLSSVLYLVNYLQLLIYLYFSHRLLSRYQRKLLDNYSDVKKINLSWLKTICYGFLALITLDIILALINLLPTDLYNAFLSASSLFIVVISYSALGQVQIQYIREPQTDEQKYRRSGLRKDSAQYYIEKLNQLMEVEKCFLEDDLGLDGLAEKLGVSAHHLSQILNNDLDVNFYDYINDLRINYAKHLLTMDSQRPIIEIAYASGYSNKASFYNSFKRFVNMTPSKYRSLKAKTVIEEKIHP